MTCGDEQTLGVQHHVGSAERGGVAVRADVVDLGSPGFIATGICFLDHMIDQLTSHAQLGVEVRTSVEGRDLGKNEDYCAASLEAERPHDRAIVEASGEALGVALRSLARSSMTAAPEASASTSVFASAKRAFCCPLDEAFTEAVLDLRASAAGSAAAGADGGGLTFALAPYGVRPKGGRIWVGRLRTELTEVFWSSLTKALRADLSLRKVRGENAHHIIEATFKAFARVFRSCLDGAAAATSPEAALAPAAKRRRELDASPLRASSVSRRTKETGIEVKVDLDGEASAEEEISTGVVLLDRVLNEFRSSGGFSISASCTGDRHIDDHHTVEDVGIALGQCLFKALGDKKGLVRMGCAEASSGEARVRAVVDLSNRPHFVCDLEFDEEFVGGEAVALEHDDGKVVGRLLSCEMLHHVFDSLTLEMRATAHLEQLGRGHKPGFSLDLAIAAARAYGAALADCCRVDPRRAGTVASSKGTLSV